MLDSNTAIIETIQLLQLNLFVSGNMINIKKIY